MTLQICHISSVHTRYDIRIFEKECKSLTSHYIVYLIVADGKGDEVRENVSILDSGRRPSNAVLRIAMAPWRAYRKALSIRQCQIFHFHDPELLLVGYALRIFHGKKVVYDVHEDVPRDILLKQWIPKKTRIAVSYLYEKIENFVSKRISLVVCSTPYIQQRLIKVNPNTISVKNYPNLGLLMMSAKVHIEYDLCYIGSISSSRGIITILNILHLIKAKFALAGVFDNKKFEDEVRTHPNWKLVHYLGVLSSHEVKVMLSKSAIGIVVLDETPTFIESLPIKLFEYMASGLAVIASDFPLWKEIVENAEGGLCIPPNDEQKLLETVNFLLDNKDLTAQMGRNGSQAVRSRYTWESEFSKLLGSYKSLMLAKDTV